MKWKMKSSVLLGALATVALTFSASADDWTMWGRTPQRHMVSPEKNPPIEWNVESGKNVKWKANVGSKSYGNPVVSQGYVFVGTNNEAHYDPQQLADGGNELCFSEADGKFVWQHFNAKLAAGRVNDWPQEGLCATAMIEGDRLYYPTNRCEVWCWDIAPLKAGGKPRELWHSDMMSKLGVFPHNMTSSSMVAYRDFVYVITGNGVDDTHKNIPAPNAPAIVCFNKNTGEIVWSSNVPGENILHGQWASVSIAEVNGRGQVLAPLGDGWVYAFDAENGKIVWKFDCNPKNTVYPTTRNELIATAVVYQNRMYIAAGQDPEHGEGPGHLWCVDITKTGDVSMEVDARPKPKPGEELIRAAGPTDIKPNPNSGVVWHFDKFDANGDGRIRNSERMNRSISTVTIDDERGLLYAPDFSGFVHCLDVADGKHNWTFDMEAAIWGSALLADGKVYLCDEDGDVTIFESAKTLKEIASHNMGSPIYCSPVYANGVMYLMNREHLFAIQEKK